MQNARLRKVFFLYILMCVACSAFAQQRKVENRPYTDLRPFHFGIVIGSNLQDMEFNNVGSHMLTFQDGRQMESCVTVDQHNWDIGFNVGVLGEVRLNKWFAFRMAPQLYFGNKNVTFYNFSDVLQPGHERSQMRSFKTVYIGANFDLIYSADRFNNHRPYIMAGVAPMANLSPKACDYVKMKSSDVFLEVGMGCDFYLPFFKLRPEIKFMYGLSNCLDKTYVAETDQELLLPYTSAIDRARSKMFVLSFYFE